MHQFTQARVHSRITNKKHRFPSWSGFYELVSKPDFRSNHCILTTLTFFTCRNQFYISRDQKNARYNEKNLEGISFSSMLIKLYTRKYLMWRSHWKIMEKVFFTTIIPRTGGFHIDMYITHVYNTLAMYMLCTIYSLFKR